MSKETRPRYEQWNINEEFPNTIIQKWGKGRFKKEIWYLEE